MTERQHRDLSAPVGGKDGVRRDDVLWFAGEGTSRRFFGYLHGAFWEGKMAARKLVDCERNACEESWATSLEKRNAEGMKAPSSPERKRRLRKRMWGGSRR